MEFEVKESNVEDGTLTLAVEVSSQAVAEAYRNVRKELSRYVRIPGFRKGKTPLNVLANHIGKERFQREVERELLPQYYYRAIEETGHRPVSPVTYDEKTLGKNKPFFFKATVAVAPEVELGDYKSAEVEVKEPEEVTDEEVEKRLDELRLQASSPEEKEGAAEEGDLVQFDVVGKVDDQEFPSLSRQKVTVRVGDDGYFPGFDKELVGCKAGDSKDFSLPAPDDAANPKLANAEVNFHVEVLAVRSVVLPVIDEEFLSKLRGNIQSEDDLKSRIRVELEQDRRKSAEEANDMAIQDMLLGLVDAEPPAAMLDSRVEEKLYDFREQFKPPYSYDDYLSEWGRTEEDVKAELREGAVKTCQIEFALDEIAKREGITASDEEVAHRLRMLARMMRRSPMDIEEMVDSSGSRVLEKQKLTREKAFAWLKSRSDS